MESAILELINYGALGIVVILLVSAVVYLAKKNDKKDEQILEITISTTKLLTDLSAIITTINSSTSNIPKDVREALSDDFNTLSLKIENLNKP